MRSFRCGACDQLVFFDNSVCLRCQSPLGYLPSERQLAALRTQGDTQTPLHWTAGAMQRCGNALVAACNWLVPSGPNTAPGALCSSCRLTSVRPADDDPTAMAAFAKAEAAKRRLLDQLAGLGLPIIDKADDPEHGLTFELLSSRNHSVTTGHHRGVLTLDLSESDDAYREFVRQQLGEPYRTVLGHLRHEIGHHYWSLLVGDGDLTEFRRRFGDERADYQAALEAHYNSEPPNDGTWATSHVSRYATMHPWEDWAETFAHYLHIVDGLETAEGFGLVVGEPSRSFGSTSWRAPAGATREGLGIGPMIDRWLGLTVAMNAMSRSIGQEDLYPFILSPGVIDKLEFVHRSIAAAPNVSATSIG